MPDVEEHVVTDADTVLALVRLHNMIPPLTVAVQVADSLFWYWSPSYRHLVYIAFFYEGCYMGALKLGTPQFRRFVPAVHDVEA